MQSKKKVYQLKPTLGGDEAIEYLSELIDSSVDEDSFRTLAIVESLKVFVSTAEFDTAGLKGREINTGKEVIPLGLHELLGGLSNTGIKSTDFGFDLELHFDSRLHKQPHIYKFEGPTNTNGEIVTWQIPFPVNRDAFRSFGVPLIFKPADIKALANTLDAKSTADTKRDGDAETGLPNHWPMEASLDPRERTTMLRMIHALAVAAKMNLRGASPAVQKQLEELGFNSPREKTIRNVLSEAAEIEPDNPARQ